MPWCRYSSIMDSAMAAPQDVGLQPVPMSNWPAFFYFVAFVILVPYMLLNIYIGKKCTLLERMPQVNI
jgi:hypothetical protein